MKAFMISSAVAKLAPSATLAITAKAKQMVSAGEKVISFAAGQPDFDTPDWIKDAAKKALDEGFTKYTATSGIEELKQAIVGKLKRENDLEYTAKQIIVTNGAKQALFEAIFALSGPGDEVIIPMPIWVSIPEMAKASGATPVLVDTGKDLKLTVEMLQKAVSKKSKLLVINSPCNPTGVMYSRKELELLVAEAVKQGLWIVSDECYEHFYYGSQRPTSIAALSKEAYERTVTVQSLSKTYSMTGWRVGYAAASEEIIAAMSKLQDQVTSNANSFAQKGAVAALNGGDGFPKMMREEFSKRRKVMVDGLNAIEGMEAKMPEGAFYVWADIRKLTDDDELFCERLLNEAKVAVIPGSAFGGKGFIRLSFATSLEQIEAGIKVIDKFVRENKWK